MTTQRRLARGTAWAARLLAVTMASWALAGDYFVATNGSHEPPFGTWGTAATNLQAAVLAANAANDASTVWVSNGYYAVSQMIAITNARVCGYADDPASVVVDGGNAVRPFLLKHANAWLSGVTVVRGRAADAALGGNGGGVYLDAGRVSNCAVTACAATGNGGGAYLNGGWMSTSAVWQCEATNSGGGLYLTAGTATACAVWGNLAGKEGGGISIVGTIMAKWGLADGCVVVSNTAAAASSAGGVYCAYGTVRHCTVSENIGSSPTWGIGGIYALNWSEVSGCFVSSNTGGHSGGFRVGQYTVISNCVVVGNEGFAYAGAMYLGAISWIRDCRILANTGLQVGGIANNGYEVNLANCLIAGNLGRVMAGGAVLNSQYAPVRIEACTFAANVTTNTGSTAYSGGLYLFFTNIRVRSSIFYENLCGRTAAFNNYYTSGDTNLISFSCATNGPPINGNAPLLPLDQGNLYDPPQFENPGAGDYRLGAASPCLNTGLNLDWMAGVLDLDGQPRIDKRYGKADMGCFERPFTRYTGAMMIIR